MIHEIWRNLYTNIWFYILAFFAIGLLIAGLVIPPPGVIDPSVLKGAAEIFGWGVLGTIIKAIDAGVNAKLKHGDTTLEVGDLSSDDDNNDNNDDE